MASAPRFVAGATLGSHYLRSFTGTLSRWDADPVRTATTAVDRVDALLYAAQQNHTLLAGFVRACLLGEETAYETAAAVLGRGSVWPMLSQPDSMR